MALGKYLAKYQSALVYLLLSLAVLLPLLRPGFILTLDMVFTPHIRLPNITTSSYLFYAALHVLNFVFPADLLQKLVLFAILFLSGIGMHRLWLSLFGGDSSTSGMIPSLSAYIAGALYMINPYTYARFMAGQFAVLLGYCLFPFFVMSLLALLARPSLKRGLILGGWITLIAIASIHSLGIVAILMGVALVMVAWRGRHDIPMLRHIVTSTGAALGVFVLASSYWLVPLVLGHSGTAAAISGFTTNDDQAFATLGDGYLGRLANVVRLQGFWAEGTRTFLLPQANIAGWGIIALLLWGLIIIGAVASWRSGKRFVALWFTLSGAIAILVAIGVFQDFLAHLPLLQGFREPHKFVGLAALVFALFTGKGAYVMLGHFSRKSQALRLVTAIIVISVLPFVLTHTMFWGFVGQLQPVSYPATWTHMNQRLDQDRSNFQVLFLPWHLYMYYRFTDRIIASPAASFFDKPTITSNDLEFKGASPNTLDPQKTLLTQHILPAARSEAQLGARLAPLRVKYILLDKDNDYTNYNYLDHQTDLRLIEENANFNLYVNDAFKDTYAAKS